MCVAIQTQWTPFSLLYIADYSNTVLVCDRKVIRSVMRKWVYSCSSVYRASLGVFC